MQLVVMYTVVLQVFCILNILVSIFWLLGSLLLSRTELNSMTWWFARIITGCLHSHDDLPICSLYTLWLPLKIPRLILAFSKFSSVTNKIRFTVTKLILRLLSYSLLLHLASLIHLDTSLQISKRKWHLFKSLNLFGYIKCSI